MKLIASKEAQARLAAMLILQKEGHGKIVITPISENEVSDRVKAKFLQKENRKRLVEGIK